MKGCLLPKEVKFDRLPLAWRGEMDGNSRAQRGNGFTGLPRAQRGDRLIGLPRAQRGD